MLVISLAVYSKCTTTVFGIKSLVITLKICNKMNVTICQSDSVASFIFNRQGNDKEKTQKHACGCAIYFLMLCVSSLIFHTYQLSQFSQESSSFSLNLPVIFGGYSCNISNTRNSVSSDIQTPRRELKIRRAAEYF